MHVSQLIVGSDRIHERGHVNYKEYRNLFEAEQEWLLSEKGLSFVVIERDFGVRVVVVRCEFDIDFDKELLAGDSIDINTEIALDADSMLFIQSMTKAGQSIANCRMRVFFVTAGEDGNIQRVPIPVKLRELFPDAKRIFNFSGP